MEALGQPYESVMRIPSGRRRRFAEEKQHLDKWRAQRLKSKNRTGG